MLSAQWLRPVLLGTGVLIGAACSRGDRGMGRASQTDNSMGMAMASGVEYTVALTSDWTRDRFPFEYPEAGALTGPHFSGLIGATHTPAYTVFAVGSRPTPGLERLSEEGKHSPLDDEIRAAVASGNAGVLFESDALRDFKDSLVVSVRVDAEHPLLSLVAMIAPSPDWFTGVANVDLRENGEWVASKTLELWAYDSGGDDGSTYKAPDNDNNPKQPISRTVSRHFAPRGTPMPVGMVTITRK